MKAISAVIAIVLILIITVGLVSLAYMWFTGMFSSLGKGVSKQAEAFTQKASASFEIDSISQSSIYIRNTGQSDLTNVVLYVNGNTV
ncbi:MAG: hypothetical protein J7K26_00220, partial [Candidatus Aenigmarchaeota archaeon]|nr:hypothetical protein [Candidatus Aenigmarchaeota archaeon]